MKHLAAAIRPHALISVLDATKACSSAHRDRRLLAVCCKERKTAVCSEPQTLPRMRHTRPVNACSPVHRRQAPGNFRPPTGSQDAPSLACRLSPVNHLSLGHDRVKAKSDRRWEPTRTSPPHATRYRGPSCPLHAAAGYQQENAPIRNFLPALFYWFDRHDRYFETCRGRTHVRPVSVINSCLEFDGKAILEPEHGAARRQPRASPPAGRAGVAAVARDGLPSRRSDAVACDGITSDFRRSCDTDRDARFRDPDSPGG